MISPDLHTRIQNIVQSHDVVLFMKGTSEQSMCGFSATVVSILRKLGADFKDVNVFDDADIREGIKTYSDWPTIPQLYIKGTFVGGCDITRELFQSGELQAMLGVSAA